MKGRLTGLTVLLLLASLGIQAAPTDEERIEEVIEAVVDAYRTGDYTALGRLCAPEVTVVPSDYAPPVSGWSNIEPRYRAAHAAFTSLEVARENTSIVRRGKFAWATYQWRLAGTHSKGVVQVLGHTTLILEKRGQKWLIVHNHTSMSAPAETPSPAPAPPRP